MTKQGGLFVASSGFQSKMACVGEGLGGVYTISYDLNNNIESITSDYNRVFTFEYDDLNLCTSFEDALGSGQRQNCVYDEFGNLSQCGNVTFTYKLITINPSSFIPTADTNPTPSGYLSQNDIDRILGK